MNDLASNVRWTARLEKYFADTGERCSGLNWLHKKSEERYSRLSAYTDIPVIVLGVVNGSVSIGSSTLFPDPKFASIGVGLIALFTAIISTVSSYFSWAKRAEGHRISAIHYSKLNRFLSVQLSLPRSERMTPADLLRYTKETYDKLAEVSPLIAQEVIQEFKNKFTNSDAYKHLSMPSETNGLEPIEVYTEDNEKVENIVVVDKE